LQYAVNSKIIWRLFSHAIWRHVCHVQAGVQDWVEKQLLPSLGLSVVELFPARGEKALNVHEASRLALRKRLAAVEEARFRVLRVRAAAHFADDPAPAGRVELIYHPLCGDPQRGATELESLDRDWISSARPEDGHALASALSELEDTRFGARRGAGLGALRRRAGSRQSGRSRPTGKLRRENWRRRKKRLERIWRSAGV
jgi:hypothetical protein